MKVLILTPTFPDSPESWKGIFVKEQTNSILKEHEVCVVKTSVDYSKFHLFLKRTLVKDIRFDYPVYRISVCKSIPIYNQLNYFFSAFLELKKIIKSYQPDIIHCHYSYPSGIIASLIKWKYKIPFVVTEHTRIKTTFRSFFHKKLSIWAMNKSFKVIAVSNSLKGEILEEGVKNVTVIPNVVEVEKFTLASSATNPFTIGFLGSLNTHNKGLGVLLNACVGLPFPFKLKIGGGGILLEYYKDLARELGIDKSCVFCGNVNQNEVVAFYNDLNTFVLASKYETFGIVLVEALSCGIPVIATNCGGPLDVVNQFNGVIIDVDNPAQLNNALVNVFNNYHEYSRIEIRKYVNNNFSPKSFLEKINHLYNECINHQPFNN